MSDELLPYYQRELAYIRKMGGKFADANPKIAARLRIAADTCEDPHVERMIEAFAYLTARIRHKLEDDFPELSDAMLGVLYPHYIAPIPSMAIVQFILDRSQGELTTGYTVPKESAIETEPIDGEPCRFRTCYPVTLWPIELVSARLTGRPFTAPATPYSSQAAAVLRLELACMSKDMSFAQLALQSLRFFLKGQDQHVYDLYELIHNNTLEVAIASSPRDGDPILLDRRKILPVGFERDEGMLPYTARSFMGYRLLSEFFAFPKKFLFFDLAVGKAFSRYGNKLEVYFYLNRTSSDLEQNVDAETLRLGCTPIVNLFRQQAEPVELTHMDTQYHVVPDKRRPLATEIYSIDRVVATAEREHAEYAPFYSYKHGGEANQQRKFWYMSRRSAIGGEESGDMGTEAFLTLVDLDFKASSAAGWTVHAETTCLNRDLPYRLPFGGDQPRLQLSEGGPLCRLSCLTQPTPTLRPNLQHGAVWRLISQLTLNHLSISDGPDAAQALQEILRLYDFADSSETRAMIDGILTVTSRRVVGRAPGHGAGGFCRGIEVSVHFSEPNFSGGGLYLFASVLERFLGMYASINSFSRLVASTTHREGVLRRWSPRAGEKILL